MERHEILEMMATLKLAGMRAAYDEVVTSALKRQLPIQAVIGELLQAQLANNRARSTAYRLGKARFPLAKTLAEFDFTASPVNASLGGERTLTSRPPTSRLSRFQSASDGHAGSRGRTRDWARTAP